MEDRSRLIKWLFKLIILLRSKQNAKFFDFLDKNRPIFVVLSGRLKISSERKGEFGV